MWVCRLHQSWMIMLDIPNWYVKSWCESQSQLLTVSLRSANIVISKTVKVSEGSLSRSVWATTCLFLSQRSLSSCQTHAFPVPELIPEELKDTGKPTTQTKPDWARGVTSEEEPQNHTQDFLWQSRYRRLLSLQTSLKVSWAIHDKASH